MLDIRFIREHMDQVQESSKWKKCDVDLDRILQLDDERCLIIHEADTLKEKRNLTSAKIGEMINKKQDVSQLKSAMKRVGEKIKNHDEKLENLLSEIHELLLWVPNIIHASTPRGASSKENELIKSWGKKPKFSFRPVLHWELGVSLNILDFKRASKMSGSGFVIFKNDGVRLQRALIQFMLDVHREEHGCSEVSVPFLVDAKTMTGTGQLPKLKEDMYRLRTDDLYLIPTAEVPVTNMFQNEIMDEDALPINLCSYTPCFRREAGSYGKETKGLQRLHQFDKVEVVKFVKPETSYDEHEILLEYAERILQKLELHYRVMVLSAGDLSFAASKCYDIEVWASAQEKYLEVSSCSNFEDFQARRSQIRFKDKRLKKNRFVHTLNASGIALPRTIIAILEQYQQKDGSVIIPEVLRPYMGQKERLQNAN